MIESDWFETCFRKMVQTLYKVTSRIVLISILLCNSVSKLSAQLCKEPTKITKEGDYKIAALFPIHFYNQVASQYELNLQATVLAEAFIFAVEEINTNRDILGNKRLGYMIYDTCSRVSIAQRSILEIILDTPASNDSKTIHAEYISASTYKCMCRENYTSTVVSVIGGASSKTSTIISTLLGVDLIPQISYSATSTELSDKRKYPSFLRTIPPDNFQAEAILGILQKYGWTYINVLASDNSYGRVGIEYLLLDSKGVCVAILRMISTGINQYEYDNIVRELSGDNVANVTVLWCGKLMARAIMDAAGRIKLHGMTWIATEAWGSDEEMEEKDPLVVKGIIGVTPLMKLYYPFESHIVGKAIEDLSSYKAFHNATICKNASHDQNGCLGNHIFQNASYTLRSTIPNVIDATYAIANGLRMLQHQNSSNSQLLNVIKNHAFTGSTGMRVQFNKDGDPTTVAYSLVNMRLNQHGSLEFKIIGQWDGESKKMQLLDGVTVQFAGNGTGVPVSRCAEECSSGFYALMETNKKCCWKCLRCPEDTFKAKQGNQMCTPCTKTSVSNQNSTGCIELTVVYLKIDSVYGIIIATLSVIGATMSLLGVIIFLVFRDTPLVRSSNKELSILQLTILALSFLYPFIYMTKPKIPICYARPLIFGVLFSISNSIIFTKADRLLRIFKMRHRFKRTSFALMLSNKFQLLIVAAMAGLAIFLCVMCYMFNPPMLTKTIDRQNLNIDIQCINIAIATNCLVAYMGIISVTCIVYTIKSKDLPMQYREGRYIGMGMFVSSLVWLFYLPISMSGQPSQMVDFAFCLSVCISNVALLSVIYGSKAWRIILNPKENNPAAFRTQIMIMAAPAS